MTIEERLAQGTVVLMDGGTGTEIERRGQSMDNEAWCGIAHMDASDLVMGVHEDYIHAGAEIIIANTFATSRAVLAEIDLDDQFVEINFRAVELARQAREQAAIRPVWIAGSISSMVPLSKLAAPLQGDSLEDDYRRQAEILADAGADLIVAEMMFDREGALPVVRGAASVGLPLWVGFSASVADNGAVIGYSEERIDRAPVDFGTLVDEVVAIGGDVAGVMHSYMSDTGPALDALAGHWRGPMMAYAETGRFVPPNWVFEDAVSPDDYAEDAAAWVVDHGVQIVGGCCGTGPEHIRALRDRLASATR